MSAVATLPPGEPDLTLGWDVLWWTTQYIRQPDGPTAGDRWRFTREQVRFILWWYAIDRTARWRFVRGVLRRAKGWGKSPFVAALALAELCGPVRFDAWARGGERRPWRDRPYRPGEPITRPVHAAWVQLGGNALAQTSNTMSMVLMMCRDSPIVADYGLDLGLTRIFTAAGGRLEPITTSGKTAEGARPTAVYEDETHLFLDPASHEFDRTNRRNVGKSPNGEARLLETTNAHAAGAQSVAEHSYEAYLAMEAGKVRGDQRLLYDSVEASPETDLADEASLMAGLAEAYGDSTWVDLHRIRDEVWDPATPPSESRRFYLNQIAESVDAWMTQPEWAACCDATKIVRDGDAIAIGFDGSRQRAKGVTDATALIGCRVRDGHLFELGVWEQPLGPAGEDWAVPESEVEAAVAEAFRRFQVVALFADPALWWPTIAGWEARWGARLKAKASAQRPMQLHLTPTKNVAYADALHSAVLDRQLTHDGSFRLTQHVLNARRRVRPAGVVINKEHPESPNKIDAAVAASYAWQARLLAVSAGSVDDFIPRRVY